MRDGAGTAVRDTLALTWRLLSSRRGVAWAVVLVAAAGGLAFVPQFGLLNYYFCFAIAWPLALAALHVGGAPRLVVPGDEAPTAERAAGAAVLAALALALLPLAVVTLNALRVRNCDWLGGLAFYGMGPVLGGAVAAVVGLALAAAVRRVWLRRLVFGAILVLALVVPFWRFYAEPPVHLYHPVVGYFSGAVYDDVIEIRRPFVVYRLTGLLEAAALVLLLSRARDPRTGRWRWPFRSGVARARRVWLAVALVASVAVNLAPATLGYRYDRAAIRSALGGLRVTPHFEIVYAGGTPYEAVVARVAAEHERAYETIAAALGRVPDGRVRVFIYPDSDTKRRLMGADRVYVTKPWLREIHLNRVDVDADVIRHELVHALAAACAPGPLNVPAHAGIVPHMGVVEGIAEAIEWSGGRLTLHEASAAMRRLGIAPDMRRLMGPEGFWTTAAGKAYVTSGSFVRWLLETYGTAPLCPLYHDADFEAAYGRSAEALITDWEAALDDPVRVPLSEEDLQLAKDSLDRPSVFGRVCALEVAVHERAAGRAAARREFGDVAELLGKVAGFDPENPEKRFAFGAALLQAGRSRDAAAALAAVRDDPQSGRVLRLRARVALADVLWFEGERFAAADAYRALLPEPMAPAERRGLRLRAELAGGAEARAEVMREVLVTPLRPGVADGKLTALSRARPDDALLHYLLGRLRLGGGRAEAAADELEAALAAGPLPGDLLREAYATLGVARFLAGELDAADGAFEQALARCPYEGERVALEEWRARTAWFANHGAPGL